MTSEQNRRIAIVNLALSHKWSDNEDACKNVLERYDWSAVSDDFLLAHAVLRDDFAYARTIMRRIGNSGVVSKSNYNEWPLFKKFRETSDFSIEYSSIFGPEVELSEKSSGDDSAPEGEGETI